MGTTHDLQACVVNLDFRDGQVEWLSHFSDLGDVVGMRQPEDLKRMADSIENIENRLLSNLGSPRRKRIVGRGRMVLRNAWSPPSEQD